MRGCFQHPPKRVTKFQGTLLVLSQCKTTSAYKEPRSSGNEYTNSLVVKIMAHYTSPCYFLNTLCEFPNLRQIYLYFNWYKVWLVLLQTKQNHHYVLFIFWTVCRPIKRMVILNYCDLHHKNNFWKHHLVNSGILRAHFTTKERKKERCLVGFSGQNMH